MKKILEKYFNKSSKDKSYSGQVFLQDLVTPVWSSKNYQNFAKEAYQNNVIASRCINLIAKSAASVDWLLYQNNTWRCVYTACKRE